MGRIRVLIVDDSVVVRRMLSDVFADDPDLEVAGTAPNGKIGLSKLSQINPDVVILDIDMPELDGLETLAELRKGYPRLPVLMFSSLTQRGALATLDALAAGANDYVTKPAGPGGTATAKQYIREELIPKIKEFCGRARSPGSILRAMSPAYQEKPPIGSGPTAPVAIVAVAVSTGGPNALGRLMPAFAAGFSVPIVVVQHMPPLFTRLLAERLASHSHLDVREGTDGEEIGPGMARLAPGNYHMVVSREGNAIRIRTHQAPPVNSCRPAADVLFRSVAETYGGGGLGVVLTGMGQDGFRGSEALREAGGRILAQDEATSIVWGMPGIVARAGLADQVLPLDQIGPEIVRRVAAGRASPPDEAMLDLGTPLDRFEKMPGNERTLRGRTS